MKLLKNIRFYILIFSLFLSVLIYWQTTQTIKDGNLQIIRLTQYYALIASAYLYLAVMIGPVTYLWRFLSFGGKLNKARRAIGVSAFYFATLHASLAFFGELGGFAGLPFLPGKYLLAIILSFTALLILSLMAATSFDFMVAKLGFTRWKILHRLVYLVILLVTIHALLLGTHFQDPSGVIPQIFLSALAVLLLIEANRFDAFLERKFSAPNALKPDFFMPHFGVSVILVLTLISWYFWQIFGDAGAIPSLGIHAQHIQLAREAQQVASSSQAKQANLPAYLQGDKTKRYTVTFLHPDVVNADQDTKLQFLVFDASNGNPVNFFLKSYAYPMHLMIVDSQLNYFTHIHPVQNADQFTITTRFPHPGYYHLYIQFQPVGAIEQQMGFTLVAGNVNVPAPAIQAVDTNLTKVFDDPDQPGISYEVTLDTHGTLKASQMTLGQNTLTYTIKDAKTKQSITNLKPFMSSFGHLTLINEQTYDLLHVHPSNLTAPPPDANGGPTVDFLPIGIYGPIKPGIYRAFGEFSTKMGTDFDTDFTLKIE